MKATRRQPMLQGFTRIVFSAALIEKWGPLPDIGIIEIRDGKYSDGISATPLPDGFHYFETIVDELAPDRHFARDDNYCGPFPTVQAAVDAAGWKTIKNQMNSQRACVRRVHRKRRHG